MKNFYFRFWNELEKKMIYPCVCGFTQPYGDAGGWVVFEGLNDPFDNRMMNPMLSTGILAEKSHRGESELDRMIFDGDIVKLIYIDSGSESIHEIRWGGVEYPAFDFYPRLLCESNGLSFVMCSGAYHIEIIGNINYNPEILED